MELYEKVKEQIEQATILISPHPLTNFEILKYQNEHRLNGVCSRIIYLR